MKEKKKENSNNDSQESKKIFNENNQTFMIKDSIVTLLYMENMQSILDF